MVLFLEPTHFAKALPGIDHAETLVALVTLVNVRGQTSLQGNYAGPRRVVVLCRL